MNGMTHTLERYDRRTAAGILARAALEVATGQEYRNSIVENERALRTALIAEARAKLGVEPDDESPEVLDKIGSYLDTESERFAGPSHVKSAFERLIARGDFPSDLYEIRIISEGGMRNFFGKDFEREKGLIERTVRAPSREQHFGVEGDAEAPRLVSLFAREFWTPFQARNFTMLVAGQRGKGQILDVHMAWRLYASKIDLSGAPPLIELLQRFANVYGLDIQLNGRQGRFFLTTSHKVPARVTIEIKTKSGNRGRKQGTVTRFVQRNPKTGKTYAALVMAIDLDLYRSTLKHWDSDEIS
jgi:hypothetical protein